jgi:uncharacterized protein (TIGR02996 family)
MTRDQWETLLDEDPVDPQRRLEYADWLEERGLGVEAEVQRWLARERRRPNRIGCQPSAQYDPNGYFRWSRDGDTLLGDPDAWVPEKLWVLLSNHVHPGEVYCYKAYPTRLAAERALAAAWGRLKEAGETVP